MAYGDVGYGTLPILTTIVTTSPNGGFVGACGEIYRLERAPGPPIDGSPTAGRRPKKKSKNTDFVIGGRRSVDKALVFGAGDPGLELSGRQIVCSGSSLAWQCREVATLVS